MSTPAVTAREDDSLELCASKMLELRIDELPVVDDNGELSGFLSVTDLVAKKVTISFSTTETLELFGQWFDKLGIEKIYENAGRIAAKEIMSKPAISIGADEPIKSVFEKITRAGVHSLVVVEGKKPVGVVSSTDFLKLLVK